MNTMIENTLDELESQYRPAIERFVKVIAANNNQPDSWYWNDNARTS